MHAVDLHASASALLCGDLLHALFVQQIDLHAEDPRELLVSGDVELEQLPDTTKPASLQLAQFWRVWCSPFDNVLGFGCKTASKAESTGYADCFGRKISASAVPHLNVTWIEVSSTSMEPKIPGAQNAITGM